MELSPRSPRSIQESTSSSSSELQPFINVDDHRSLQGQDEISVLEQQQQQQQQLYDCHKEQIPLRNEIRVLRQFVDNSSMLLQQLEDGMSMNFTQLGTCVQEMQNMERKCAVLQDTVKATNEQLEHFETVERLQNERTAMLHAQLESLEREYSTISNGLRRADQEAKALSREIENLQMQLLEKSDNPPTC